VDEWQSADERNNRERLSRVRQAAEELFKPAPHSVDSEQPQSASRADTPTEAPQRRQPRIFTVPPRLPTSPAVEPAVTQASTRRKDVAKKTRATVPPSQIGRVRTLATYGMTPRQVADLYGVTVEEIDRILKAPPHPGSSQ
jgi:cytoskeletal protein RodZ